MLIGFAAAIFSIYKKKNKLYLFPVEAAVEEFQFHRGQHHLVVLTLWFLLKSNYRQQ